MKKYHVISNTHWDREWRFPFQRNRKMLVDMIDKVLEILDKEPEYRAFHLDSQSIVLKDYLEVKPQNSKKIKKYVEEKRLFIGPWYILPDEFQVGGENLIRNLLLGKRTCDKYGGASKTGYSPFSWGQISQLPQIYKNFGVDVIMFYRGVNSLDSHNAEFIWEGADGTKALTSRFSTMPRYNFYFYIYRPVIHNEGFYDVEYVWERGGTPFHLSNTDEKEDYYIVNPLDTYFKENLIPSVESIIKNQASDFTTDNVIWMEGHDSSGPNIRTVDIIRDIKKEMPDVDVVHSTLEDYQAALKSQADYKNLPLVKGERRSAQYDRRSGNMFGYTTSARMYLKQKNFDAERWLFNYAEMINSVAGINGMNINDNYIQIAEEYLIQNSAHDSIGGCSLDEIHNDMMWRYKQVIEISNAVFERGCKFLAANMNLKNFNTGCNLPDNQKIFITLVNPVALDRDEVVEMYIDIPANLSKKGFYLVDANGNKINYQLKSSIPHEPVLEQMIDRPLFFKMIRNTVYVEVKKIPQTGIKTIQVIPCDEISKTSKKLVKKSSSGIEFENEFLKASVNKNGTLNIRDKRTGKSFKNIGYFYDEGEAGHAWVHNPVKPFITTLASKPVIKIIENGELIAKCHVSYTLKVPVDLTERKEKKKLTGSIRIDEVLIFNKLSGRIDFEIKVNNLAESHRLRLMFPVDIKANYSYGEGQFDVVERSLERPDTKDWVEQPMYDYPMHNFVDLSDDVNGAAVLVDGLKEYEVIDDKHNTIAVTLIRGFEYVIQPSSVENYSWQKGAQCLGENNFRISFMPHEGNWKTGNVFEEALKFNNKVRSFQSGYSKGKLLTDKPFFTISNSKVIVSCLKTAEQSKKEFVLRVFNPSSNNEECKIQFAKKIKTASLVTMEEETIQIIKETNPITVTLEPKKVVTVKLSF